MMTAEHPDLDVQKKYWNDKWDWSRTKYPHDWAWRRGEKILAFIDSLGLKQPKILDLGCGTGWFAGKLGELGPTMGIDLSEQAIAQARSQFSGIAFEAGDLFKIELPEQHFDVVVSQEVIAHVADQAGYLQIAARCLKPEGHLVVTTPNRYVNDRMEWPAQPPGHIEQWISSRQLKEFLRPQFRVLRSTTAVPMGDKGLLRLVNSARLTHCMEVVLSKERVQSLKEWAGFGWTLLILAQKRS